MRLRVSSVARAVTRSPDHLAGADPAGLDIALLYRAHERTVMRWAARLGGPEIDVEDVVQDVFLVAKRRLRSFDGAANVKTWLFRTTEKIVQAARRKGRFRRWLSRSFEAAA